jgi:uncharacterized protein (TIGR00251 family)
VTVRLKVSPGASREGISRASDGALKLAVTAAPERGRANEAAVALLAKALGVSKSSITVVAGATARNKTFRVAGDARVLATKVESLGHG